MHIESNVNETRGASLIQLGSSSFQKLNLLKKKCHRIIRLDQLDNHQDPHGQLHICFNSNDMNNSGQCAIITLRFGCYS